MQHTDLLQTIAAIAVTLVGFIGIAITTGRLSRAEHTPLDRITFYAMVAPTLTALFCAFIPELASTLCDNEATIWRIANLLLGLLHLANIAPVLARVRSLRLTLSQKAFLASGLLFILAHFAVAAGLLRAAEFVFLAGLLQQLAVGIFNFLRLVIADDRAE